MKLVPILIVAMMALAVLPETTAAPLGGAGKGRVETFFSLPGYSARCYTDVLVAFEYVNARLLANVQSPYYVAMDEATPRTETYCGMAFVIQPGVFVNPCDTVLGTIWPAVAPTDPYFNAESSSRYTKRVNFANGGWAHFAIGAEPGSTSTYFSGDCRSGPVSGTWGTFFARTHIG